MNASILVDTHALVYAYDRSAADKQRTAISVLDALARRGVGVLSTQVLDEFIVTVTRKLPQPLSIPDAQRRIEVLLQS